MAEAHGDDTGRDSTVRVHTPEAPVFTLAAAVALLRIMLKAAQDRGLRVGNAGGPEDPPVPSGR